jgi:aryl-alcohol dehydrogenase-like predicted oxidoreductase
MTETDIGTQFLGGSGLRVPVLALGTMTSGGTGRHASARPLPYPCWHQQKFNASRMRYTLSGAGL